MKTRLTVSLILAFTPFFLSAQHQPEALEKAIETIDVFKEKNPKFETYFDEAYGYVVFPSVAAGASGIGGAHGTGTVFEQGNPIGKAKISKLTVGMQFGGQAYRQIICFETENDLQRFKENKFEFAAQASAIAIKTGVATNLTYRDGVAVFTITKAGLMYEAALGGQKPKIQTLQVVNEIWTAKGGFMKEAPFDNPDYKSLTQILKDPVSCSKLCSESNAA